MKKKWKRFRTGVIDWFKDVVTLVKDNKKIAIIVAAFVVVIVAAIVITSVLGGKSKEVATALVTEDSTAAEDYAIPEDPLETDAYPEINDLMKRYYGATASGDLLTVNSIRTGLDDKEKIVIQKKSEYITSYPLITCYTKKGPVDDSYLVYAYYEVKLDGYEEAVPGLNAWYVCKNAEGNYIINEDPQDEKIAEYCKIVSVQDDVQDLSNTVNVKFNEVMSSNDKLAAYMDELTVKMKVEVGEELAKAEAETAEPTEEEVADAGETSGGGTKVKATTVVNVRASDSESADRVGKAQEGQIFTLLEEKVNGWSKIDFEGKEAFIKTEFLEKVGTDGDTGKKAEDDNNKEDDKSVEEKIAASPSSGTATVSETINVREKPSTDSEKIGVCYEGEKLEVVKKQSDGWTKVKYNGKTGYVKSEFLK